MRFGSSLKLAVVLVGLGALGAPSPQGVAEAGCDTAKDPTVGEMNSTSKLGPTSSSPPPGAPVTSGGTTVKTGAGTGFPANHGFALSNDLIIGDFEFNIEWSGCPTGEIKVVVTDSDGTPEYSVGSSGTLSNPASGTINCNGTRSGLQSALASGTAIKDLYVKAYFRCLPSGSWIEIFSMKAKT